MFVDWRTVNAVFCGAMWILVLVLAVVIVVHKVPAAPPAHQPVHALIR
jgi:hypothetical protein